MATGEVGGLAQNTALRPQLVLVVAPEGRSLADPGPKRVIPVTDQGTVHAGHTATSLEAAENDWSFPFNAPAAPGEGDNQALAVNTQDGSAVYDVALAVLWVTDGDVDEINEAWALAKCQDCTTVSVAFQSIFIIGDSDVVVPQNRAVAVNYECARCQTHAVAVQLITTLTRRPSERAMAELSVLWNDLEELGKNIKDIPLEEIHVELTRVESEILKILAEDGVLAPMEGGAGADDLQAAPEASPLDPTPTLTPSPTASAEATTTTDDPSPTPSGDPSPTPSDEPSPTPSDEPSESPGNEPSPQPTSSP